MHAHSHMCILYSPVGFRSLLPPPPPRRDPAPLVAKYKQFNEISVDFIIVCAERNLLFQLYAITHKLLFRIYSLRRIRSRDVRCLSL